MTWVSYRARRVGLGLPRVRFCSPSIRIGDSMDPLSQVLRSLRLRGSFYAAWDLGAPWGLAFRRARFAPFHYVESGEMWLVTTKGERIRLAAGDVAVLFDGG